ncbi:hypothetical protein SAMD00019534_007480, partial [Acytostelium subglobosum LB1]|uniref:hypothetical protein n=1 Tax=Acytostelium subglobosum LB1 TaxID=1410327 RepID=UPI0006448B2C
DSIIMDLTAKVKGFLSSAVSSPVKDFDLKQSNAHTKYWKIHDATKKTSGEDVSVFLFDKKQYEKMSRSAQDELLGHLKREAQSLIRLRHPSILNVVNAVEETKISLYFATEPVLATLDNLIQQYRQRSKSNQVSSDEFKQHHFTFEELEIQLGISQLLEGIHFLNTTAKLLHRNIAPESIFITKNLKWKIGGLGFSCSIDSKEPELSGLSPDFKEYIYEEVGSFLPSFCYLAPEYVQQRHWEYNSDLYSIGRIICELALNLNNQHAGTEENLSKMGPLAYYATTLVNCRKAAAANSNNSDSAKVCTILLGESSLRGDLDSFIRSAYFQDVKVKSLVYLTNIVQKEDESKLQFFRGLFRILSQFSERMRITYILPTLISELANERIVYVVLPNVFSIANTAKKELFNDLIAQPLIPILLSKTPKNDVLSCILDNVNMFIEKSSNDYIRKYILPVVLGTLCGPTPEIIFQCLSLSVPLIKYFDPDAIVAGMIPRLTNLCIGGFPLHIRTKSIHWFSLLVPLLDKKLIVDSMIPSLERVLSVDNSPPILEALVVTYEAVSKKLGGELLALKVLPALIPLSADKHLDLEQFKTIMKVVKDVLATYENERYNELNNLRRFTKNTSEEMNQFNNVIGSPPANSNANSFEEQATPKQQELPKITIPTTFLSGSSSSITKASSSTLSSPPPPNTQASFFDSPDFSGMSTGPTRATQPTLNPPPAALSSSGGMFSTPVMTTTPSHNSNYGSSTPFGTTMTPQSISQSNKSLKPTTTSSTSSTAYGDTFGNPFESNTSGLNNSTGFNNTINSNGFNNNNNTSFNNNNSGFNSNNNIGFNNTINSNGFNNNNYNSYNTNTGAGYNPTNTGYTNGNSNNNNTNYSGFNGNNNNSAFNNYGGMTPANNINSKQFGQGHQQGFNIPPPINKPATGGAGNRNSGGGSL